MGGIRLAGDLFGFESGQGNRTVNFVIALTGALIPTGAEPRTDGTLAFAHTTTLSMPARVTTIDIPSRTTAVN